MDQKQNTVLQFTGSLRRLASWPIDKWPAQGFPSAKEFPELAREIKAFAQDLLALPISELPMWQLSSMKTRADSLVSQFQTADTVALPSLPPEERRMQELQLGGAGHGCAEFFRDVVGAFAYLSYKAADLSSAKSKAERTVTELEKSRMEWTGIIEWQNGKFEELRRETLAVATKAREILGDAGATKFAATFDELAIKESTAARQWLWGAAALYVAAMAWALVALFWVPETSGWGEPKFVTYLVSRVAIVGLFVLAALWCSRMYRARAHLTAVQQHRAAALTTFKLLVTSAHGSDTRDAVLRAATDCIFAPSTTGLMPTEADEPTNALGAVISHVPTPWSGK